MVPTSPHVINQLLCLSSRPVCHPELPILLLIWYPHFPQVPANSFLNWQLLIDKLPSSSTLPPYLVTSSGVSDQQNMPAFLIQSLPCILFSPEEACATKEQQCTFQTYYYLFFFQSFQSIISMSYLLPIMSIDISSLLLIPSQDYELDCRKLHTLHQ